MSVYYSYVVPKERGRWFGTELIGSERFEEERPIIEGLAENLKLAKKMNDKVRNIITHSSNYIARNPEASPFHVEKMLKEINLEIEMAEVKKEREWYQYSANLFMKYNIGNCGAMTIVGGMNCREPDSKIPIYICFIPNGNHQVLVIGQGESAVVCDPWSNCFYPLDRRKLYLRKISILGNFFSNYPLTKKTNTQLLKAFSCIEG